MDVDAATPRLPNLDPHRWRPAGSFDRPAAGLTLLPPTTSGLGLASAADRTHASDGLRLVHRGDGASPPEHDRRDVGGLDASGVKPSPAALRHAAREVPIVPHDATSRVQGLAVAAADLTAVELAPSASRSLAAVRAPVAGRSSTSRGAIRLDEIRRLRESMTAGLSAAVLSSFDEALRPSHNGAGVTSLAQHRSRAAGRRPWGSTSAVRARRWRSIDPATAALAPDVAALRVDGPSAGDVERLARLGVSVVPGGRGPRRRAKAKVTVVEVGVRREVDEAIRPPRRRPPEVCLRLDGDASVPGGHDHAHRCAAPRQLRRIPVSGQWSSADGSPSPTQVASVPTASSPSARRSSDPATGSGTDRVAAFLG
jgi:hypothetical protein